MSKAKKTRLHQSLTQQILGSNAPRVSNRIKSKSRHVEVDQEFVGEKLSMKILEEVRLQQDELEEEFGIGPSVPHLEKKKKFPVVGKKPNVKLVDNNQSFDSSESDDEENELGLELESESRDLCPIVDEEDEKAMKLFMSADQPERRTLADIIMDKIKDKQTEIASQMSDHPSIITSQMDDRVVAVFHGVGLILSKYRAGKLPKAFKVIPSLSNWEEVLYLTEPNKWSSAAMFQATRLFASNLSAAKAQRFYNLVLLPRIRDDIVEYKRLNFHLYAALKKALFKPAAFFKGLLLPLCESSTCSLREALIISSVLAKCSIPMLHSSAALLKISEMEYSGSNSIFMRTLFDKKYALPYRVIDAAVFHFLRFQQDPRPLPVLWHQNLLVFVQRYKEDMSLEQKESLLELIRVKSHPQMSPEIRREIVHSKCRDIRDTYMNKSHGMDS